MADEQQTPMEIPEVPGLFARLTGSAYRAFVDQAQQAVAAKQEQLDSLINHNEEKRNELRSREGSVAKKEQELSSRESDVKAREEELARREQELARREQELAAKKAAFRENEKIAPSVSDKSVDRDKMMMQALSKIQEVAERIKAQQKLREGVSETADEKFARRHEIRGLQATLLGLVAAYRDMLPDRELQSLVICGKSCPAFLQDLLGEISESGKVDGVNHDAKIGVPIPTETIETVHKVYRQMVMSAGYKSAQEAYQGAAYEPLSSNLGATDRRGAGMTVLARVAEGRERTVFLMGGPAIPRATDSIEGKSPAERKIEETSSVVDGIAQKEDEER